MVVIGRSRGLDPGREAQLGKHAGVSESRRWQWLRPWAAVAALPLMQAHSAPAEVTDET